MIDTPTSPTPAEPPAFLTTQDMAARLGMSVTKFNELVRSGAIPDTAYFKHQRTYRFHVRRVEESLLDGTSTSER